MRGFPDVVSDYDQDADLDAQLRSPDEGSPIGDEGDPFLRRSGLEYVTDGLRNGKPTTRLAMARVDAPRSSQDSESSGRPIGIAGGSKTDEVSETDSFIYNPSFTTSEITIASYNTDKTINSRKSRYNALPRHKYAGIGHPRLPQSLASLDVDEASVPKVCRTIGRRDNRHYISVTFQTELFSSPLTGRTLLPIPVRPTSPNVNFVEETRPTRSPGTQPLHWPLNVRGSRSINHDSDFSIKVRHDRVAHWKMPHRSTRTHAHSTWGRSSSVRSTAGRVRCCSSPPHPRRRCRKQC